MEIVELLKKYFNRTIKAQEYEILKTWIESSSENKREFETLVHLNYIHCMTKSEIDVNPSVCNIINRKSKLRRLVRQIAVTSISTAAVLLISFAYYNITLPIGAEKAVIAAKNSSDKVVLTVFNAQELGNHIDTSTIYKIVEIDEKDNSGDLKMVDTIDNTRIISLKVPTKLNYKVTLEDGSTVWINSDSELRYPNSFAKDRREVYINGEAAFDVVADKNRPFIVTTSNSQIKVLGTIFNVNSYEGANQSSTTLISGKIELSVGEQTLIMNSNEKAIIEKDKLGIKILPYEGGRSIAWITGKYYFDAEPLSEIINVLSRWYDVRFTFTKNSINNLIFTGTIDKNMPIEDIINMLTETVDFEYKIENNQNITIICK